jgi:L-asparagine transporter-like permease
MLKMQSMQQIPKRVFTIYYRALFFVVLVLPLNSVDAEDAKYAGT